MKNFKYYVLLILKGIGIGTANVIPGVSGGTVALITGIFEELIDSIKSFDIEALRLLLGGKLKKFAVHVNLYFLLAVFSGVAISILSLAKVLEFLFVNYPVYIWAYFFGLILASIYFVGRTIGKWRVSVIITFLAGTTIALCIAFLSPATENKNFLYLIVCGVVAICSMILPGLSGSFVLILLGNYHLVVIEAINDLRFDILLPILIGAVSGLIAFSHLLSWIFKKFRDETIASLTGFILGSLIILWPWKQSFDQNGLEIATNTFGAFVDKQGIVLSDIKVYSYRHFIPDTINGVVIWAAIFVVAGVISIWLMEKYAGDKTSA